MPPAGKNKLTPMRKNADKVPLRAGSQLMRSFYGGTLDNNYRTIISTGTSDPQWDNFLCSIENGHHEQSTYWAKVKAHQGWRAFRIKVLKGNELFAGAQMLCKRLPFGGSVGYISSGPCYVHTDHQALGILVRSINGLARKQKIQYTAVTPYVRDERLSNVFGQNGYSIKPETLPPSSSTTATCRRHARS